MSVRDMIPWGRGNGQTPQTTQQASEQNPFLALHREMNRLFDDTFRSLDTGLFGRQAMGSSYWPSVEISETDKEIKVAAEVPGIDQKDIEVLLEDGVLTLRGEKKIENTDESRQFSERYYGQFERRLVLDSEVEGDKVSADFRNGVLTVTLPKTERAQAKARRIAINGMH